MAEEGVHEGFLRLSRRRASDDAEEMRLIVRGLREGVHRRFGRASMVEYLEWIFGYERREAYERVRVARELVALPRTTEALARGELRWTAVRELSRVAVADTEAEWIDAAKGRSVREVERIVAGRQRGDRPSSEVREEARTCTVRFDRVSAATRARLAKARERAVRETGESLDDDAFVAWLAERALAVRESGERDAGRAAFQVQMTVCPSCSRGTQNVGGEQAVVDAADVAVAACDAQRVADTHVGTSRAAQDVAPRVRRAVMARDRDCCAVPGCRNTAFKHIHHIRAREQGGEHTAENLIVLCSTHHRLVHLGTLVIEREEDGDVRFRRADGHDYQAPPTLPPAPKAQAIARDVALMLEKLGFKAKEAERYVEKSQAEWPEDVTIEDALRAALLVAA